MCGLDLSCFPGCPVLDLVFREVRRADHLFRQGEVGGIIEVSQHKRVNKGIKKGAKKGKEHMTRFPWGQIREAGAFAGFRTRDLYQTK